MRAHLADFGLARAVASGATLTRTGAALGTPRYASPEQARGETRGLTPATDTWGLGVVLYELLAGRPAFDGDTSAAVIGRVLAEEPVPLRALRPDLPAAVEALLAAALAKAPGRRYRDARAILADLDRLAAGGRPRGRPSRRAVPVAIGAAFAVAGLGVVGAWTRHLPAPVSGALPIDAVATAAEQAWARRHDDPAAAAARLADVCARPGARPEWHLRLGLLRWALGDGDGARAAWDRVPPGESPARAARLARALERFFLLDGLTLRADLARDDLQALASGTDREGRLASAALAAGLHEWARAEAALAALGDDPGWETAMLAAYLAAKRDDPVAVERETERALAAGIPLPWLYYNRGCTRADRDDHAGAIADYTAALRVQPRFAAALQNRANSRHRAGDAAGAVADHTAALALVPENPPGFVNRASAHRTLGDLVAAEADASHALTLDPTNADAWEIRGRIRLSAGRVAEAEADFTAALARRPGWAQALANRGSARFRRADLDGAAADLEAALACDPAEPTALHNRGILRRDRGDHAGAVDDLTRALAARPDDPETLTARAVARALLGDHAAAILDYEAALRVQPDACDTWCGLSASRLALGDIPGAAKAVDEARRRHPEAGEPFLALAFVREDQGDWPGVAEAFREFVRRSPTHSDVPRIREWLAAWDAGARQPHPDDARAPR